MQDHRPRGSPEPRRDRDPKDASRPGGCLYPAPGISIVIVTYRSRAFLPACLDAIPAAASPLTAEIIIVDNACPEGTADWVRRTHPRVLLIANTHNRGFAAAGNQGMAAARGRFILLLNPDTVPRPGAMAATADYLAAHPGTAAASCKVVRPDGRLDPSCKRNFPGLWDAAVRFAGLSRLFPRSRLFARYDARYLDEDRAQEVPLIDGCYMMIRREALERIGPLDERFFMYAEEMDWCRRAHQAGWSIGYDPSGTTVHIKGASTRTRPLGMLFHFHRSMGLYYWKHGKWRVPGMALVLPGLLLRYTLLAALNLARRNPRVSD
ncbi:MAG: glycosyltransferase family 2 protein [Candidatus Krumholzibacteriia bacterium]